MKSTKYFLLILFASASIIPTLVSASTTDGTIDPTNRYAWNENAGWLDFGDAGGNVHVTDAALTGYVWSENTGWISLNCSNGANTCASVDFKVANDGNGTLSGHAWGENTGWIDFSPSGGGVTINSSGVFSGYAWSENLGWINFSITNPVTTDWRPASARTSPTPTPAISFTSTGGGGGGQYVAPTPVPTPIATSIPGCPKGFVCSIIPGYVSPTVNNQAPIINNQIITNNQPAKPTFSFKRDLKLNDNNSDVLELQKYLNTHDFLIAKTGNGSSGNETTFFGPKTQSALIRFQKAKGIIPASGYFGPITRAYINKHQ